MATVRKRVWTWKGEKRSAWIADYFDGGGKRHQKTFETKSAAWDWLHNAKVEIRRGVHTADADSITVKEAGDEWIKRAEDDGLERSTICQYQTHLDLHITPFLGAVKLSRLTAPMVTKFRNDLSENGRSRTMIKRVLNSLGAIIATAQADGRVAQNVVRDVRHRDPAAKREGRKIEIPSKDEIRALINNATGRFRPLLIVAIFCGLRASELRGLRWADVDFERKVLHVRQRADQWGVMGPPKSKAGNREIPLAPIVVSTLKEWKLACPKGELGLVFPTSSGTVEDAHNIRRRWFEPLQVKIGIVTDSGRKDGKGNPIMLPKYGLHALRHVAASLFIEQGFGPKRIQAIMGHSSIELTFTTYGHLFPSDADDQKALAQVQARLLG